MKQFNRNLIIAVSVASLVIVALGLVGPTAALAATSPSLGAADSYSIISQTGATNTGITTISGDVGVLVPATFTDAGTATIGPPGTLHLNDLSAQNAQLANTAAFLALSAAPNVACTTDWSGTGVKDLVGLSLVPGIYCADAFALSGTLTLDDSGGSAGVWIFRSAAALNTSSGVGAKVVFLSGVGLPCNVWWKVVSSATIGTGTAFIGNILASTSVALQTGATLNGRAFAQTGAVTLDANTISGPICTVAAVSGGITFTGTINVVKLVVNDNGGTKTVADFPLFINGIPVVSGTTNIFPANSTKYTITETNGANYTQSFSGDCDSTGVLYLQLDEKSLCIVTNNDIGTPVVVPPVPPVISVLKVPSPLSLPAGPGAVTYTYTLHNIGTVPVTDITMVGDTCSPIVLASGDTNSNAKLEVAETWVYRCSTTLTATHTNTVVATGWANGISATDIASATVVVGTSTVPPLINITKVPSPLTLLAGGGMVTYTKKITNPGTVALSNVQVSDDKCSPITYISGDTNSNSLLETTETWTYTCRTNITSTTTNTAVATGVANSMIARDFAIATVAVASAVPALPNTGVGFDSNAILWGISILAMAIAVSILFLIRRKKTI